MALLAVAPTKYEVGIPSPESAGYAALFTCFGHIRYDVRPLVDVLIATYESDAHFTAAVVWHEGGPVHWQPRLVKTKCEPVFDCGAFTDPLVELRARRFDVRFDALVADVDTPKHQKLTRRQVADLRTRLAKLSGIGWYTTKAGARIIQPVSTQGRGLTPEEYEPIVARWLILLQGFLGPEWVVDKNCADWTRQFRCPRVLREGDTAITKPAVLALDNMKSKAWGPIPLPPPKPPAPVKDVPTYDIGPSTDRMDRARSYISKMPIAVEGDGGSTACFNVARELIRGFALLSEQALVLLREYSGRCLPPWSEKELQHKIKQASCSPAELGYRLKKPKIAKWISHDLVGGDVSP